MATKNPNPTSGGDTNSESRYLTVKEAAAIAHRSVKTLYDWSSRGLLDGCKAKMPGRLLIDREAFHRLLADGLPSAGGR